MLGWSIFKVQSYELVGQTYQDLLFKQRPILLVCSKHMVEAHGEKVLLAKSLCQAHV